MANVQVDFENPPRAVLQLLMATLLEIRHMKETIKLMDIPLGEWKVRKQAMSHADSMQADLQVMIDRQTEICVQFKRLGY